MSHRSALRGMEPEEAFRRLNRLMEAYFEIRLEGALDPLTRISELTQSETPRIAHLALVLQEHLEWLKTWFPESTPEQLLHIADLTSRAFHRETNRSPEDQLIRLVVVDVGTLRARTILDHLDQGRTPKPQAQTSKRTIAGHNRKLFRRLSRGD